MFFLNRHMVAVVAALTWLGPAVHSQPLSAELRSPWENIADSVILRLPAHGDAVALSVESQPGRSSIENIFVAKLSEAGFTVTLAREEGRRGMPLLRITPVPVSNEGSAKCEARWEAQDGGVTYLGNFDETANTGRGSGDIIGRLVEPLVVIAGAAVIVYLFFTVRS